MHDCVQPRSLSLARLAFVLGALVLVSSSWASTPPTSWVLVGGDKESNEFVDPTTALRTGARVRFWLKDEFFSTQYSATGPSYATTMGWVMADCESRTWALLSLMEYDNKGKEVLSYDVAQPQWGPVTPGSALETALLKICGSVRPSDPSTPNAPATPTPSEPERSSGSGFVVGRDGWVLTNHHVVKGCSSLTVVDSTRLHAPARVVATDPLADLALLKAEQSYGAVARFRNGPGARLAEGVVALGFPLPGLLASDVNVSLGNVSALSGIADDSTRLQISAPVQPGNSGGPLLDLSGNVIGVVVSKLDALKVAKWTGDVPQNINFAIKGELAQVFLRAQSLKVPTAESAGQLASEEVAARGRAFTVKVECNRGPVASAATAAADFLKYVDRLLDQLAQRGGEFADLGRSKTRAAFLDYMSEVNPLTSEINLEFVTRLWRTFRTKAGHESDLKAGSLVDESIVALGGRKALKSFKSLQAECTFSTAQTNTPARLFWRSPNQLRVEVDMQGNKVVQVFDGQRGKAFIEVEGTGHREEVPLSEGDLVSLRSNANDIGFAKMLEYKERGDRVEYLGTERVGDEDLLVLQWRRADGRLEREYLDPTTKLTRRVEKVVSVGGKEYSIQVTVSDYRDAGGIKFPFNTVSREAGSQAWTVIKFVTVEVNPVFPDDMFALR